MVKKVGCGEKWQESFARFDPHTASWKTPQLSLFGGLEEFSETWPRWGMMRNGVCFRQPTWEHPTGVNGYGSEDIIGTPIASPSVMSKFFLQKRLYGNPYGYAKLNGGIPNPEWLEGLMGFPIGWTAIEPLAMHRFQRWLSIHSAS